MEPYDFLPSFVAILFGRDGIVLANTLFTAGHGTKAKHQILSVDPLLSTCDDKRNTTLAARHFQCDITAAFLEHHKHDLKNDWREKEAASNLILYSPDLASLAAKPNGTVVAFETGLHLLGHIAEALTWRYADRACRMYRLDDQVLLPIALDLWDLPEERHRFAAALPLARKCLHQVLADRQRNVRYVSRFLHFLNDACVIHSARLIGQSLHQLNVDRIGKKLAPLPQELCDKITCLASDLDSRPSMRGTTSGLNHLKQLLLLDLRSAYAPWPTDNYTGCDPHYPCQCRKGNRLLRTDGPNVIWSLGARAFVHVHSRKTKSGRAICVSDGRVCEGHQYGPLTKTKEPKLKMMKRKISQKFTDGTNEQWEMSFMDWHLLGELISPHGWSFSWKTIC